MLSSKSLIFAASAHFVVWSSRTRSILHTPCLVSGTTRSSCPRQFSRRCRALRDSTRALPLRVLFSCDRFPSPCSAWHSRADFAVLAIQILQRCERNLACVAGASSDLMSALHAKLVNIGLAWRSPQFRLARATWMPTRASSTFGGGCLPIGQSSLR